MSAGRGKEGYARSIWLHLCKEGGMWTPDEVAPILSIHRDKLSRVMHNMVARNNQLRRDKVDGRVRFGVTAECVIPLGITVKQLADAGVIGARE